MGTGTLFTNLGRKVAAHRIFDAVPAYNVPSQFTVGVGTTTPNLTDTALASAILIAGATAKNFVAGYPVIDDTTFNITIRGVVATTECNGNTLTEFGVVNTDGTPRLMSRCVHTAITKTSSIQVIYYEKDKIED